jgi:hypothetical protein
MQEDREFEANLGNKNVLYRGGIKENDGGDEFSYDML